MTNTQKHHQGLHSSGDTAEKGRVPTGMQPEQRNPGCWSEELRWCSAAYGVLTWRGCATHSPAATHHQSMAGGHHAAAGQSECASLDSALSGQHLHPGQELLTTGHARHTRRDSDQCKPTAIQKCERKTTGSSSVICDRREQTAGAGAPSLQSIKFMLL